MNYWDLSLCLLLLVAVVAIWFISPQPGRRSWFSLLLALCCPVLFVLLAYQGFPHEDQFITQSTPLRDLDGGFSSSATCRSCHPGEFQSWHNSYHRSMTMLPSAEGIKAPFDGRELKLGVTTCRVWQDGDEFWVSTPDPDHEFELLQANTQKSLAEFYHPRLGPAPPMVDRRVVLTTGSHKMQMFWLASSTGKQELRLFPWVYFIPTDTWIPYEDSFIVDPRFGRPPANWNESCIVCHSVNGKPKITFKRLSGGRDVATATAELGIACEACHGPAREHIEKHSNPLSRYLHRLDELPDSSIFNASRASQQQSSESCGQCHSTFEPRDYEAFNQDGMGFRPGMPLDSTHRLVFHGVQSEETHTHHDAYWEDGTIRTGGREYLGMVISACYERGGMTCLDCHSMHDHQSPDDQISRDHSRNSSCLKCHAEIGENLSGHTHHPAQSEGSRCYNCHMPHTSFALMGAIRSHRIDSPSVANEIQSGRPNACNLCHLDRTLEWTAEKLHDWYGHDVVALDTVQTELSAAVRWTLGGDAVQRAIGSWHMGWGPALEASGQNWQLPHLNLIRGDAYSVNRFVAQQAMQNHSGFAQLESAGEYDFIAPVQQRSSVQSRFLDNWQDKGTTSRIPTTVLLSGDGKPKLTQIQKLIDSRDNRPIMVAE